MEFRQRRQWVQMYALFDFLPDQMTARFFGRVFNRWRPIRDQGQFVAIDTPRAALFCASPSLVPRNFDLSGQFGAFNRIWSRIRNDRVEKRQFCICSVARLSIRRNKDRRKYFGRDNGIANR